MFAHGTEEQLAKIKEAEKNLSAFKVTSSEELGLEIIRAELADGEAKNVYEAPQFKSTVVPIRAMGKLYCKRWNPPQEPAQEMQTSQSDTTFDFMMDVEILEYCLPGFKMEVTIKELDIGIKWIDHVAKTYVSFFTWLENERIREWNENAHPFNWTTKSVAKIMSKCQAAEDQPLTRAA